MTLNRDMLFLRNRLRMVSVLAGAMLAAAVGARGAVVLGEFDWDTGGDLQGWTEDQSWTSIGNPGPDGSGYLEIDLAATDPTPGPEWSALVSVDASTLFAGNWQNSMSIAFDFFADDYSPGALQLQWQGDSGYTWSYVLTPGGSTGQWATYSASFSNWEDWDVPGATEEMYLSDLAAIDWIGIYIFRSSPDGQMFGLDDFRLLIPEPSEYAMIAAVLFVFLIEVRRRRVAVASPGSSC